MAKSLGKYFFKIKSEYRVMILGNIFMLLIFCGMIPLFFYGHSDWPFGILCAIPFANLNYFMFIKSVDGILSAGSKKGFRLDFFFRYLVLIIPIAITFVLWYYSIKVINPIAIVIAYIVYRIGLYLPLTKDVENE